LLCFRKKGCSSALRWTAHKRCHDYRKGRKVFLAVYVQRLFRLPIMDFGGCGIRDEKKGAIIGAGVRGLSRDMRDLIRPAWVPYNPEEPRFYRR
jgi:hypothetical protein